MNDEITATCPQCGAPGKAGYYCEYCGAKIPFPVTKEEVKTDGDTFSWFNIVPQDYTPDFYGVVGDPEQSLYMVVKKCESRPFVESKMEYNILSGEREQKIETRYEKHKTYAIIDRCGKFVVDPQENYSIDLFTDNYDYIIDGNSEFRNLSSGEIIKLDYSAEKLTNDYLVGVKNQLYNRKQRIEITLDKELPSFVNLFFDIKEELCDSNTLVFKSRDYDEGSNIFEKKYTEYDGKITIVGDHGMVSFAPVSQKENTKEGKENTENIGINEEKKPSDTRRDLAGHTSKTTTINFKKLIKWYFIICGAWLAVAIVIPILGPFWIMYIVFGVIFVPVCLIMNFVSSRKKSQK